MRYTGKNRKSDNEEGKEELLCEVKTAIWCCNENDVCEGNNELKILSESTSDI